MPILYAKIELVKIKLQILKIALIGYGKMGKAIEEIVLHDGHEIVMRLSSNDKQLLTPTALSTVDVAIEFSTPESAFDNIKTCIENDIPVISGTTGWLDRLEDIKSLVNSRGGAFLYASNFSLGVNLFFAANTRLSQIMASYPTYECSIEETHHTSKKDAPSGTAITLANDIIEQSNYSSWALSPEVKEDTQINIDSKRIENVPGTHIVRYENSIDKIEISHTAKSRRGFALGAYHAAKWIIGKKGVFSMKDVLGL